MDVFYEESAVNAGGTSEERKYNVMQVCSNIFLVLGLIMFVFFLMNMPFGAVTSEEAQAIKGLSIVVGILGATCLLTGVGLFFLKLRFNVSYDYSFVSGELRISKVFGVNRRKLLTRLDCQEVLQIGDTENASYERIKSDPMTKLVICTPNATPTGDKFFMYILVNENGKKLYVLECRETMLMHILKFARRSALESDYVMQEKKRKEV
ncbi:MAG: hypothetical protein IJV85_04470 [Clostridia bacterium]|nr:hypothetical protein [Clostridia bacterium]